MLTVKSSQFSSNIEVENLFVGIDLIKINYAEIFKTISQFTFNDVFDVGVVHGVKTFDINCHSIHNVKNTVARKTLLKSQFSPVFSSPTGIALPLQPPPTLELFYNGNSVNNINVYVGENFTLNFKCSGYNLKELIARIDIVNLEGTVVISKSLPLSKKSPYILSEELHESGNGNYSGQFVFISSDTRRISDENDSKLPLEFRYYVSIANKKSRYYIVNNGVISFIKQ